MSNHETAFDPTSIAWGETMRLARRSAMLANEEKRRLKVIADPLESSIMLYTDDPIAAAWFVLEVDMASLCKASAIEGVAIIMGETFPPESFEAERTNLQLPRVAAMWFPPPGVKCPRCRNFTRPVDAEVCPKCADQLSHIETVIKKEDQ